MQTEGFSFFIQPAHVHDFFLPFLLLLLLSTYTPFNHFLSPSFSECQVFVLLRQPSEGAGGSKLAFGNEPGSAVGGQRQQGGPAAEARGSGSR